jgi:hypothetical protein
LEESLKRGFILKDASAFNVLFEGTLARLVDVHSIEPYREGTLWAGYAQFCRAFLFPLLLWSHKGVDPRPMLLAGLGEIGVDQIAPLFSSWRDRFRPGVFINVRLQQALEARFAGRAEDIGRTSATVRYPLAAVVAQVVRLRKTIVGLRLPPGDEWAGYATTNTYDDNAAVAKQGFVSRAVERLKPHTIADLGTNTGHFARLARASGARVIALDSSAPSIDGLYRRAQSAGGDRSLHPVVSNLTRPTPAMGWRLQERASLTARLKVDLTLALALVHHLRLTGGIPLAEVIGLLTSLAPSGEIEWVGREDPMVKRLLALRPDVYDDYDLPRFEQLLAQSARIVSREPLPLQGRTLYEWAR